MHPPELRELAVRLRADGVPFGEIHHRLGLSRNTVAGWLCRRRDRDRPPRPRRCPICADPPGTPTDPAAYAYLLGQYLGDGHLLTTSRVPLLTIACDNRYTGLIHEVTVAIEACGATAGYQE